MTPSNNALDLRGLSAEFSESAINRAMALHVLGWEERDSLHVPWRDAEGNGHDDGDWATSADSVIPLLEPFCPTIECMDHWNRWHVKLAIRDVPTADPGRFEFRDGPSGQAPTFAMAACVALLATKGVKVLL